jgi:hypothetical protein
MPRNTVRLGRAFFVINITVDSVVRQGFAMRQVKGLLVAISLKIDEKR